MNVTDRCRNWSLRCNYNYSRGEITVKRYQLAYPTFSKQTVHEFKKAELNEKEAINKEVTILKSRKRGLSKLLLQNIMAKTIQTVKALRVKGAPVSSAVINAIAKGVVMAEDQYFLTEYGGHLAFSNQWARYILNKIMWTEKDGQINSHHIKGHSCSRPF